MFSLNSLCLLKCVVVLFVITIVVIPNTTTFLPETQILVRNDVVEFTSSLVASDGHWSVEENNNNNRKKKELQMEFVEHLPQGVIRAPLTPHSWRRCVRHKRFLFIGNSHLRDLLKHSLLYLKY
eukprot:PhF_6_TR26303/c0_g2_i1/m.37755